jgi:hypothetical protein
MQTSDSHWHVFTYLKKKKIIIKILSCSVSEIKNKLYQYITRAHDY